MIEKFDILRWKPYKKLLSIILFSYLVVCFVLFISFLRSIYIWSQAHCTLILISAFAALSDGDVGKPQGLHCSGGLIYLPVLLWHMSCDCGGYLGGFIKAKLVKFQGNKAMLQRKNFQSKRMISHWHTQCKLNFKPDSCTSISTNPFYPSSTAMWSLFILNPWS